MAKSAKRKSAKVKKNGRARGKSSMKFKPSTLSKDKLDKNAFYCVKCRALCFSRKLDVAEKVTKKGQPYVSGKCTNTVEGKECGTKVNRFVKRK